MVDLASAHVRSLNFGPDTGTVSCQFQQATGKSTMPSISKWSPVIICICLCSIPYCSSDWVHIAVCNSVEHALRNRILFSFPLVWSGQRARSPGPLVSALSGRSYREGARFCHLQSKCPWDRTRRVPCVFLHGCGWTMTRASWFPECFCEESCWRNENMQQLSDVTWKRRPKMGSLAIFQVLAALASISDGFSVSEAKCWFPPVIKKWRIFSC